MREESEVPVEDSWARLNLSSHMIVEVGGMIDDHCVSYCVSLRNTSWDFSQMVFHPVINPIQQGLIYFGTSCAF